MKNQEENINQKKQSSRYSTQLSKREIQVLKLLCEEKTSKQIAAELFISKTTVDNHKARIMKKTNSRCTVGMVLFAVKYGYYALQ